MANVASRQSFGLALAELGATNPGIVVMDADLSKSTMSCHFAEKYPERFFEFGIAEANMIGAAAGMALSGKVPQSTGNAHPNLSPYDKFSTKTVDEALATLPARSRTTAVIVMSPSRCCRVS